MNNSAILSALPPYRAHVITLEKNQDTNDIVREMLAYHKKYAQDYDRIGPLFLGFTPRQTAKNIFTYLKNNVKYVIEPESRQTVKSPAAIVATGKTTGSDCKNYALFIAGVLDAINRSGKQKIPFAFRFASYKWYDEQPQHVFIVAFPNSKQETWIDPVLQQFDQRKSYNHAIDKKMALVGISGTGKPAQVAGLKDIFGKVKNAVLTVAASPARLAFLTMVKNNVFALADKFNFVNRRYPADVQKWWQNQGGDYNKFIDAISSGYGRPFKIELSVETASVAPLVPASPILVQATKFLKNYNINTSEIEGAANAGINERAQDAALPYDQQALLDAQQYKAGENAVMSNNTRNIAIIGGAALLAYILLKKK
jgi:hypothetical protein